MKRFLLIAMIVIGLDQAIGFVLHRLYLRTTSGDSGGVINGVLRQNPDVLVLGSSRARHHVMPAILQHELSVSVFNAGINGHSFLYAIMLLDLWTRSHIPPKAILLHVDPSSLLYSDEELARTHVFSGYFDESDRVRSILLMRGKYEWLKFLSASYRFNGKVLPIIKNLTMRQDDVSDGFSGLKGSLESGTLPIEDAEERSSQYSAVFWDLKLQYLSELAQYCKTKGTRLILFHSPRFQEDPIALAAWSQRLSALGLSYDGVEFLDLSARAQELLVGRPGLFKDVAHLNARGAEVFSRLLAEELGNRLGGPINEVE